MVPGVSVTNFKTADNGLSAEHSVRLIEEMLDLKIQQYAESQMRTTPELARILHEKRETDRRRLDQIRTELSRVLKS